MSRFASLVADADAPCAHTTISSVDVVLGARSGVPMYKRALFLCLNAPRTSASRDRS